MKPLENDIVFFFSCIVGMVLFMLSHRNSIYSSLDLAIFFVVVGVLLIVPLLYSYFYRRQVYE